MEMNQPMGMGPMIVPDSGKKMWVWVIVVVVVLALGAAGWYWWSLQGTGTGGEDNTTAALQQQGTSDEVSAIDADLQATDLSDLDKESANIDKTLAQ